MHRRRIVRAISITALTCLFTVAPAWAASTQADGEPWRPTTEVTGEFDWLQMKSGEWLKGEFIAMYDENVEFDSDEFDMQNLDWGDVQQVRTHQVMNVGMLDRTSLTGTLIVYGDEVTVVGDETRTVRKSEVLTITSGPLKEINFWSAKVFFGLIVREGNSEVYETNVQANVKRRTTRNRIVLDFVGNQNRTDGVDSSDNQRANAGWDLFLSKRFFVKPVFGEYFRDPFQNIGSRVTIGVGVGYQLIDSPKVDWQISGGPAYQETRYDSVAPGVEDTESTPAGIVGTTASWDITKWMEFDGSYSAQIVNEESGTYNHHMLLSFETDITNVIDFDVSWIWDRIQDPVPNEAGIEPEQDDFRTTVGLTFEF